MFLVLSVILIRPRMESQKFLKRGFLLNRWMEGSSDSSSRGPSQPRGASCGGVRNRKPRSRCPSHFQCLSLSDASDNNSPDTHHRLAHYLRKVWQVQLFDLRTLKVEKMHLSYVSYTSSIILLTSENRPRAKSIFNPVRKK